MRAPPDYSRALGGEALGARLRRASERIDRDGTRVYAAHGVRFEQRWYGVLRQLIANGTMSVGEIAAVLRITHVSVSQTVQSLTAAGIVRAEVAPDDARRRDLRLTEEGEALARRLTPLWDAFNAAAEALSREAGGLIAALDALDDALEASSMFDRIMALTPEPPDD